MIRLSRKRKTLIAGAAGICLAVPAALCQVPPFGWTSARAGEPAPFRNPNHVLHAAVERELSDLGIDAGPANAVIQPAAGEIQQTQGAQPQGFNQQRYQSEVQRQLQMLYQQDGRPMPNMVPTPQVSRETWQQYQQQHGQMPMSGRRPSRWDWLNPGNWRRQWERTFGRNNNTQPAPQPPEAPEFNPDASETLNSPAQVPFDLSELKVHPLESAQQNQPQPQRQVVPSAPPAAQAQTTQPRLFPGLLDEMQEPAAEPASESSSTLILMPLKPDGELTEPVAAPPVIAPQEELPSEEKAPVPTPSFDIRIERQRLPSVESVVQDETPESADAEDPLLDPFPELPEEAADKQSGPYSGLELELDPFTDPVSGSSEGPAAEDTNPFAPFVERHAEASVTVQPHLPPVDEVGPSLQGPGLPSEPATLPNIDLREMPATRHSAGRSDLSGYSRGVQEKMARIAAREGLTGLKGFCPVVLRDHRDLEDARAEFTVIYGGTQYWFSSDEAKQAFLMAPEAYAPVDGGVDLVQYEKTGEQQEGLLDHAAWFRGRLHLFRTAENKAAFIANPRAYSHEE